MEKKDPIQEARRYLANAKTILKDKAVKNGNCYTDSKYTRMAGNTMWNGCLIVLEYALKLEKKKDQRLEVKDFKEAASKRSIKLNKEICEAYNILHLSMGYDGTTSYATIQDGISHMENIITWCERNAPKPKEEEAKKIESKKK